MIYERIKELSSMGEIVAGDQKERKLISKFEKMFSNIDDRKIVPIEVLNYSSETYMEGEKKIEAISLPYSPDIDFDGKIVRDFKSCNNSGILIILDNLYDINKFYIKALENQCQFIVFTLDNNLRKYVVKTPPFLNLSASIPPPIPAFYIRKNDLDYIREKISIKNLTKIKRTTGYIFEIIKNAKKDDKIYVSAHHDHWFTGEHDNLASLALFPEIESSIYELHLITFTAEEAGALGYSSFSWSFGSRYYLDNVVKNLDNIILNINLDNINPFSPVVKISPGLFTLSTKYFNVKREIEIYSDGYSFFKKGIPSLTIEGINPNYHSDNDTVNKDEEKGFYDILHKINTILNTEIVIDNLEIKENLVNIMENLPLPLRVNLVNITNNTFLDKKPTSIYKLYGGIYNFQERYAKVKPFPLILGLDSVRANTSKVFIEGKPSMELRPVDKEYYAHLMEQFIDYYINSIHELSKDIL
ncbi:M28 family peptidase [Acidianus brierleyi]|nr:M28 family peptidase [Acidianus brierleyi]